MIQKLTFVGLILCLALFPSVSAASVQKTSAADNLAKLELRLSSTSDQLQRFYLVTDLASAALAAGETSKAKYYSNWLLAQAPALRNDWNYGNAIHVAHLVLGHIALASGDVPEAKRQLIEAGNTPGSPQLDTFGPNMRLAKELLARGERDIVFQYFELCARFWEDSQSRLENWKTTILKGGEPEFGANLRYQLLD